jgi:cyanate permease
MSVMGNNITCTVCINHGIATKLYALNMVCLNYIIVNTVSKARTNNSIHSNSVLIYDRASLTAPWLINTCTEQMQQKSHEDTDINT